MRIEILLPGPHANKRFVQLAGESSYQRLLESGVRIWHFQPSMLHAKVMTIDGAVANIGSANLNARATAPDEEINLVAFDPVLVGLLDAQFEEDLERSEEIRRTLGGPPDAAARVRAQEGSFDTRYEPRRPFWRWCGCSNSKVG